MHLLESFISVACAIFEHAGEFLAVLPGWWDVIGGGGACLVAGDFMVNMAPGERPSEGVRALVRQWHGSIRERFNNLDNLLKVIAAHKNWPYPATLVALLVEMRDRLQVLILLCEGNQGSGADREERNQLLKRAMALCTKQMKFWALDLLVTGIINLEELHLLRYLVPGEAGGQHQRARETLALAMPKPVVTDPDHVSVTVDHAFGENAGQVASGWPGDAKFVLVVIMAADGKTEIYRAIDSQLHHNIRMPEGSHGKLFIVKAAFLRHPDDEVHFGSESTFSMPLTTEDLAQGEGKE